MPRAARQHRMKGAIGLIRLAFRSLRYWRNRLFARHGGLQVAPVRGTGRSGKTVAFAVGSVDFGCMLLADQFSDGR